MLIKNSLVFMAPSKDGINPRYLLVPRSAVNRMQVLILPWSIPLTSTQKTSSVASLVCDHRAGMTDANDWAAICDPLLRRPFHR